MSTIFWRIEEDRKPEPDVYDGALDVPQASFCAACGKCCTHMPGGTIPADLGEDLAGEIERRLRTGRWAIDWWEGEPCIYFLRPATVGREGRIFDPSWGGRCTFLGDQGCTLPREGRPTVCKALVPSMTGGCRVGFSKWQMVVAWREHSDLLNEIGERLVASAR